MYSRYTVDINLVFPPSRVMSGYFIIGGDGVTFIYLFIDITVFIFLILFYF